MPSIDIPKSNTKIGHVCVIEYDNIYIYYQPKIKLVTGNFNSGRKERNLDDGDEKGVR